MTTYDQFEIDTFIEQSGSYTDTVMFGNIFVSSQTYLTGYTPLGVSGPKTSRRILASRASRNTYPNVNKAWLPVYVLEGYATGSFLGRTQKFVKLLTDKEVWYDSYMPNPLKIQQTNGVSPLGISLENFSGEKLELSGADWSINPFINTATVRGVINMAIAYDSLPYPSHSSASDYIWEATFPFQSRYKSIDRLFKFSKILPENYTISMSYAEVPITPTSSSNTIGIVMKMINDVEGFGSAFPASVIGHMVTPQTSWPSYSLGTSNFTVGTVTDRDFFNCFFGTGDGDKVRSSRKGPFLKRFESTVAFSPARSGNVMPRGYKYGIKSVEPEQSGVVYRTGRFGQFRDMLEQRPVSKFRVGTNAIYAPIVVNFISGSAIYPQTIDYITATNPSYNLRDSGIWDREYRSGQPYFDVD
jgi:hypothetical protein